MASTVVDYPGGSSHCCESHTDLTEAQINWQMNAAVTHGVKGLIYFTYGAISDAGSGKHPGVVTASGKPAPHYWEAQRVNKRLANLGPTLMQLRSLATVQLLCDAEFGHIGTARAVADWHSVPSTPRSAARAPMPMQVTIGKGKS